MTLICFDKKPALSTLKWLWNALPIEVKSGPNWVLYRNGSSDLTYKYEKGCFSFVRDGITIT